MRTIAAVALAAAVMVALSAKAYAAGEGPTIKARQENFKTLGRTTKALAQELARTAPDRTAVDKDAKTIQALAVALPDWFPGGSGPGAGAKTNAKSDVWARTEEFRKASDEFASNANGLARIAAAGDLVAVRRQAKLLSASCSDCHHEFRSRW